VHHTILMGPRYRGLLDDIFRRGRLFRDPSLYVHRPTASDPELAPPGCDTFYILAPVPNLAAAIDWSRAARPFRDIILDRVEHELGVANLRERIVVERMFTPVDFERELGAYLGNAFGVEPTLTQSAWFRPHNRSEIVPNLYLVGAGTHPGAGVPGVTLSAEITAGLVARDLGLAPRARHIDRQAVRVGGA
jgi:phytoene desaturase